MAAVHDPDRQCARAHVVLNLDPYFIKKPIEINATCHINIILFALLNLCPGHNN